MDPPAADRRRRRQWASRGAALAAAALLLFGASCGDGDDEGAAATSSTAPPAGRTAATQPALTSLAGTATCGDYVRATKAARENATRAALIVVRHDAGLPREPAPEVRAAFESAVDDACREQRSARMLDVMNTVVERDRQAYLG